MKYQNIPRFKKYRLQLQFRGRILKLQGISVHDCLPDGALVNGIHRLSGLAIEVLTEFPGIGKRSYDTILLRTVVVRLNLIFDILLRRVRTPGLLNNQILKT